MIEQWRASRFGSNDLIDALQREGQPVIKTMTRIGPVYSTGLTKLPRDVVERLIAKRILVPREPSEQTFELRAAWSRRAA